MFRLTRCALALFALLLTFPLRADEVIRIMAGNLSTGSQTYEDGEGNRIFQGLHPDIVLVQELKYGANTPQAIRGWVDSVFGPQYYYAREIRTTGIPNGIVSRFPILSNGVWDDPDTGITDREFVWAKIDIPGDKDLWAISVHLKASDGGTNSTRRNNQAKALLGYIAANVPAADYLVIGGDFNTYSRTEDCINTLSVANTATPPGVFVTTGPWPADQSGDGDTNKNRNNAYDWVIPDADLSARKTPLVIGSNTFPNGIVFDSRVYTPLSEVAPVLQTDSNDAEMQHMAVMRAFSIPVNTAPLIATAAKSSSTEMVTDPDSTVYQVVRGTSTTLSVTATDDAGEAALKYTWSLTSGPGSVAFSANGTNAAKTTNATFHAAGNYTFTVTVQDAPGLSVTSSVKIRVIRAATVSLSNLAQIYDGNPKPVTVTTTPAGLAVSIFYAGSATPPTLAGNYAVTATVTDPNYEGSASGTLVISPDEWALWKNTYFTAQERAAGLAADSADPDADGRVNLAEYALGSDPRNFTAPLAYVLDENGISITFTHPANLPGICYFAEASTDLETWTPATLEQLAPGAVETWRARDPLGTDPAKFLRLRFERH